MHASVSSTPFKSVITFAFFIAAVFAFFASPAYAQEAGLSISPAVIEETLDPGVTKNYTVTLKNLNNAEQIFYLSTRNIKGVQDGGTPIFANEGDEVTGYEIKDWITLGLSEITLPAGGSQTFDFTLAVPDTATPGSHFGGVFISVDPPEIDTVGAAVGYQVANIISIRVSGDAIEDATIRQFSTSKFLYGSQNVDFSVRIENLGNVLVRPSGPLEITNMLGKKTEVLVFNEQQNAVFPNSIREFTLKWEGEGLGFGRYEALLSPVYGDTGARKTMSNTVSFWILPMSIIGPALGALFVLLLATYLFVRMYIKKTLANLSYGGARVVRRKRKSGNSATLLLVVVMLTVTAVFLIALLVLFA